MCIISAMMWKQTDSLKWQINFVSVQREHSLVTRSLNVQQQAVPPLFIHASLVWLPTEWLTESTFSSYFSHFLPSLLLLSLPHIWPNCVIWRIDFPPLLLTISQPYILKHFHVARLIPPSGIRSHLAQVWTHFSLIRYSFYSAICQIRSMKNQKLP